jgi:hypothetical protein
MLLPHLWRDLQRDSGREFTLDACCNIRGSNSHCARFCAPIPRRDFFKTSLANHHVWMNAPFSRLAAFTKRYLSEKQKSPHNTSACILVPCRPRDTRVHSLLSHLPVLKEYPAGTQLFSAPGQDDTRDVLPPYRYPVRVYYDARVPHKHTASSLESSSGNLSMLFNGTVALHTATFLLDSGASASFISKDLADALGLTVSPCEGTLKTADGHDAPLLGQCTARIKIQQYQGAHMFFVCDLSDQFDVVLGDDWLCKHNSYIDFSSKTCVLRKGKRRVSIRAGMTQSAHSQDGSPPLLSAMQLKRAVRHGAELFMVVISAETDTESSATQVSDSGAGPQGSQTLNHLRVSDSSTNQLQQHALQKLLHKYRCCFPDELPKFKSVGRKVPHTIELEPGAKPPCRPMYRLSQPEMAELKKQITELLAKGYIEPSTSNFGSPVLFVRKKDGSLRMCIDYRAVNKLTVKNKYPLPRIDDILDCINGSTVFSSIDLRSGYYQIEIHPDDVPKTAFRTPFGSFQFKCLAFGMSNAPSSFQNVMNDIFREYIGDFLVVYLDDLCLYSKSPEEHLIHLEKVLSKLREHNLYANLKKCDFGKSHLDFLGHVIGADGLRVDPKKTAIVQGWPKPKDVPHLRSFLGLANYFRRFVKSYSSMVSPLTSLLRKGKSIADWDHACDVAFESVKKALVTAPVLAAPDFSNPDGFQVYTDASLDGLGAALLQEGRPVAYYSRKLIPAERNYTTTELECLAVIDALREWRCYLEGVRFVVFTDHQPLTFSDTKITLSRRLVRWLEELQRFSFTWKYKKGSENVVADSLSRVPALLNHIRFEAMTPSITAITSRKGTKRRKVATDTPSAVDPTKAEPPTTKRKDILRLIAQGYSKDSMFEKLTPGRFSHKNGLWYKGDKLLVPDALDVRTTLIEEAHDTPYSGHLGFKKTLELLQRNYWWPRMRDHIKKYVDTCDSCQRNKSSNQKPGGLLQPLPIPERNWESVSLDLITDLPTTARDHDSVIVIVDRLSKMAHFIPCKKSLSSLELAIVFAREVIRLHGWQKSIVMDRDPRFTSQFWQDLCKVFGTKLRLSTAFHPQTDGQTERMNRLIEDVLRHYVSPQLTDWDMLLTPLEFAINNATQESTGMSPFQMNYGHHPLTPLNLHADCKTPSVQDFAGRMADNLQLAKDALRAAQDRQKSFANTKRRDVQFKVGDKVMLSTKNIHLNNPGPRKLLPRWCGPFKVIKTIGAVAYKLKLADTMRIHDVFHVSLLKPYHPDSRVKAPPPPLHIGGNLEYEVETILNHRDRRRGRSTRREFLVKWVGYQPEHNTWEPEKHLVHSPDILAKYWNTRATQEAAPASNQRSSRGRSRR